MSTGPEAASPIVLRSAAYGRLFPQHIRIGFNTSRTSGLREGHGRYRVGLKDVKGALKDGYKGV